MLCEGVSATSFYAGLFGITATEESTHYLHIERAKTTIVSHTNESISTCQCAAASIEYIIERIHQVNTAASEGDEKCIISRHNGTDAFIIGGSESKSKWDCKLQREMKDTCVALFEMAFHIILFIIKALLSYDTKFYQRLILSLHSNLDPALFAFSASIINSKNEVRDQNMQNLPQHQQRIVHSVLAASRTFVYCALHFKLFFENISGGKFLIKIFYQCRIWYKYYVKSFSGLL